MSEERKQQIEKAFPYPEVVVGEDHLKNKYRREGAVWADLNPKSSGLTEEEKERLKQFDGMTESMRRNDVRDECAWISQLVKRLAGL